MFMLRRPHRLLATARRRPFSSPASSSDSSFPERYGAWIDGKEVLGSRTRIIGVENPATEESLFTVEEATPDTVASAIRSGRAAFDSGVWSRSDASHRFHVLTTLSRSLAAAVSRLARMESLQTGRPIREMNAQLGRLPEWLDYFASIARTHQGVVTPFKGDMVNYVERVPLGVVAQITPWNHPLLIAVKKIAPALAAGNSVVVKPSEMAPACVIEFARMAKECGLPDGVLNVVCGFGEVTGKALSESKGIAKIDLTGGNETGSRVGASAGKNLVPMIAELGGKAPVIVFADADIEAAVNGAAFAAFIASGQTCVMGSRILVESSIHDRFVSLLVQKVRSIKLGDPLDPSTQMGPVISSASLSRIERMVATAGPNGATIAAGGRRPANVTKGYYYEPTIVTGCKPSSTLAQEEVFGPVVAVIKVESERDAIKVANDSRFGLAASVWTSDVKRAHRVARALDVGIVWVNGHHHNDPSSPWGGMKESGIGRENGEEAYEEYTQSKSVVVNFGEASDWFKGGEGVRYG